MTLTQLKQQLVHKDIQHLYLFYGEEAYILHTYIDKIKATLNLPVISLDTSCLDIEAIFESLDTTTLFTPSALKIIYDYGNVLAKLKNYAKLLDLQHNYVIIVTTEIDDKHKIYKDISKQSVEFKQLSAETFIKCAQTQFNVSENIADYLYGVSGGYFGVANNIVTLAKFYNEVVEESLERFRNESVITPVTDASMPQLIEFILERRFRELFNLIKVFAVDNLSPLYFLVALYGKFRTMLAVKTATGADVVKETGLPYWQIKQVQPYLRNFSVDDILGIMVVLSKLDQKIKSGVLITNQLDTICEEVYISL